MKIQLHQPALLHDATGNSFVFEAFLAQKNFLLGKCLCFEHHNALPSLFKAHMSSVTVEIFQNLVLPKYHLH